MDNHFRGEVWKSVTINHKFHEGCKLEVSSNGRIRTFNRLSIGNIIKGSHVNGYPIVRLKLFTERTKKVEKELILLRKQVHEQQKLVRLLSGKKMLEAKKILEEYRAILRKRANVDLKDRVIYYHSLIHRLVAIRFLNKPSEEQTIVAHIDYDKENNDYRNLKWMSQEENRIHQQKSPLVIAEKKQRKNSLKFVKSYKLTVTRVMLLKKLLQEGKPIKNLAKQFKITETQVIRIKNGVNWGLIKAAE